MTCSCDQFETMEGYAVSDFVASHLEKVKYNKHDWSTEFICPACGTRWLEELEHPELQGAGIPKLRKLPAS